MLAPKNICKMSRKRVRGGHANEVCGCHPREIRKGVKDVEIGPSNVAIIVSSKRGKTKVAFEALLVCGQVSPGRSISTTYPQYCQYHIYPGGWFFLHVTTLFTSHLTGFKINRDRFPHLPCHPCLLATHSSILHMFQHPVFLGSVNFSPSPFDP